MAHTEGIGTLVRQTPVEDRRRFFQAAFKSVTLDGQGRGRLCTRSGEGVRAVRPAEYIYLATALEYTAKSGMLQGFTLNRTIPLDR